MSVLLELPVGVILCRGRVTLTRVRYIMKIPKCGKPSDQPSCFWDRPCFYHFDVAERSRKAQKNALTDKTISVFYWFNPIVDSFVKLIRSRPRHVPVLVIVGEREIVRPKPQLTCVFTNASSFLQKHAKP